MEKIICTILHYAIIAYGIFAAITLCIAMVLAVKELYECVLYDSNWYQKRAVRDFMLYGSEKKLHKLLYTDKMLIWAEYGDLRQYAKSIKVSDFEAKYDNLLDQIVTLSHGSIIQGRIKWWVDDEKYAIAKGKV